MPVLQEVEPEWQTAASEVLVALGKRFGHEVMADLLEKLAPGSLPHYFVVQTLASFSSASGEIYITAMSELHGRRFPSLPLFYSPYIN